MSFSKKHQTRTSSRTSSSSSTTSTTSSTTPSTHAPPSPYLQSLTAAFAPGSTVFDRAALVVQVSNNSNSSSSSTDSDRVSFSAEEQLLATKGDVKGTKPTFFDIAARSKWQAWANMQGKTADQAKEEYIDMVVKALRKPGSHPDLLLLAEEILQDHQRLQQPLNMDKDLPPIAVHSPEFSTTSSSVYYPTRKSSISQSIRSTATGMRSAATSVYELASETLDDSESPQHQQQPPVHTIPDHNISDSTSKPDYHEVTETVVEEEILNDDDYAELQSSHTLAPPTITTEQANDTDGEDEEVYQSSEEYDEEGSESDNTSIHSPRGSSDAPREGDIKSDIATLERGNDLEDEGVFDEEDKDEEEAIASPTPVSLPTFTDNAEKNVRSRSRGGSVSSGYGGSIMSDKEGPTPTPLDMTGFISNQDHVVLSSSPVVPYRINTVFDVPLPSSDSPPTTTTTAKVTTPESTRAPHHASTEGLVCPVSKKSAASGGVCPAAMFAQSRAAAAAAEATKESLTSSPSVEKKELTNLSTQSGTGVSTSETTLAVETPDITTTAEHHRSRTEPIPLSTTASSSSSISSTASSINSATRQGRRLGQGIVSRFSALRSSLAAASARAASSALSGVPKPIATTQVIVRDPNTQLDVTIHCPHVAQTKVLETEVVRLQTDISVLHERLDLLQESLKITSLTREQERRSARGILKMVLRQGLINAVLLLIVFAVLYKRRSPIAFAIIAYVGQGAKEGEAGWRAFLRWTADVIRRGQRQQQVMLNAGRRNGYW
ncbi:hypothetical protein BGZ93_004292 [Podila epicladia]|nr:hypothetical protein BGZ92_003014 [Podila epicladia]KAG0096592.1 hypothetical protein BGZ93_004292 [Podila epicladia]